MAESTALTVVERASVALKAAERRAELVALAQASVGITTITNPAGYQELHAARMLLKNTRIQLQALGKQSRDDATKFAKAVIVVEDELVALIEPEEKRLQAIQEAHDEKVAVERARRAQEERERVAVIQQRIDWIRGQALVMVARPAAEIAERIATVAALPMDAQHYAECLPSANEALATVLAKLQEMYGTAAAQEAEAARLKAEREELERQRVAQEAAAAAERARIAEEERVAKARRDAEAKAERKRLDDEARVAREQREASDRQAKLERDEQDRIAREARAVEEKAAREQRAELDRQQAEIDRQRREQEERDRQAQAELVAAEKRRQDGIAAERDRKAEEERKRLEAERVEAARVEAARLKAEQFASAKRPTMAMALEQILFVAQNLADYTDAEARAEIALLAEANLPVPDPVTKKRRRPAQVPA